MIEYLEPNQIDLSKNALRMYNFQEDNYKLLVEDIKIMVWLIL